MDIFQPLNYSVLFEILNMKFNIPAEFRVYISMFNSETSKIYIPNQ